MLTWVVYDIQSTKIRNAVIKKCMNVGLYRVQKSIFLGNLRKTEIKELILYIENTVDTENDSVYVFPIQQQDYDSMGIIGKAFDKELISNEVVSKFF